MSSSAVPGEGVGDAAAPFNMRLAILLAMAMFVLVVDTSLMNVSISAVITDLHTTASGVQSAIAHPETSKLLRKMMTDRHLPVPDEGRTLASICVVDLCK